MDGDGGWWVDILAPGHNRGGIDWGGGCFPSCFPGQPLEDGLVGDNFIKIDGLVAVGAGRVALGLIVEAEFAEGVGLVADNEGGI